VELRDRWSTKGYWEQTAVLAGQYADRARRDFDRALGVGDERALWDRFLEDLLKRRF